MLRIKTTSRGLVVHPDKGSCLSNFLTLLRLKILVTMDRENFLNDIEHCSKRWLEKCMLRMKLGQV